MSALAEALAALSEAFSDLGVRWYLFGAQAVNAYARPRMTQDIDVTVEARDVEALVRRLGDAGVTARFRDRGLDEFVRLGAVLPLRHERTGRDIDVVLAGAGLEDLALGRVNHIELEGVEVPVISETDLVVFKILAGRSKDIDDVRALLAGCEVDLEEARNLLGQLERALGQSDLLRVLEDCAARP